MTSPGEQRALQYLAHLDTLTGDMEPVWLHGEAAPDGLPPVSALTYVGVPEPGMLTAFTYGLSLGTHEQWEHGGRELCLAVRSADPAWARALAFLAEDLRGESAFLPGDTVEFGQQISEESAMTAWVVGPPSMVPAEAVSAIVVDAGPPVDVAGVYPIHTRERKWVEEHGLLKFWDLDWDRYDVRRPPVV